MRMNTKKMQTIIVWRETRDRADMLVDGKTLEKIIKKIPAHTISEKSYNNDFKIRKRVEITRTMFNWYGDVFT